MYATISKFAAVPETPLTVRMKTTPTDKGRFSIKFWCTQNKGSRRSMKKQPSRPPKHDIAILAGIVNFLPHPSPPREFGEGVRNSQMI
jgi:hypothetical protein